MLHLSWVGNGEARGFLFFISGVNEQAAAALDFTSKLKDDSYVLFFNTGNSQLPLKCVTTELSTPTDELNLHQQSKWIRLPDQCMESKVYSAPGGLTLSAALSPGTLLEK